MTAAKVQAASHALCTCNHRFARHPEEDGVASFCVAEGCLCGRYEPNIATKPTKPRKPAAEIVPAFVVEVAATFATELILEAKASLSPAVQAEAASVEAALGVLADLLDAENKRREQLQGLIDQLRDDLAAAELELDGGVPMARVIPIATTGFPCAHEECSEVLRSAAARGSHRLHRHGISGRR